MAATDANGEMGGLPQAQALDMVVSTLYLD